MERIETIAALIGGAIVGIALAPWIATVAAIPLAIRIARAAMEIL